MDLAERIWAREKGEAKPRERQDFRGDSEDRAFAARTHVCEPKIQRGQLDSVQLFGGTRGQLLYWVFARGTFLPDIG